MRRRYHGGFGSLSFPKKGSEIVAKATELKTQLMAKIEEREGRIREAANSAGFKDASDVLFQIDNLAGNHSNQRELTAGLSAQIKQEISARQNEVEEVEQLNLIIKNLPHEETFTLSFEELRYFGFE